MSVGKLSLPTSPITPHNSSASSIPSLFQKQPIGRKLPPPSQTLSRPTHPPLQFPCFPPKTTPQTVRPFHARRIFPGTFCLAHSTASLILPLVLKQCAVGTLLPFHPPLPFLNLFFFRIFIFRGRSHRSQSVRFVFVLLTPCVALGLCLSLCDCRTLKASLLLYSRA